MEATMALQTLFTNKKQGFTCEVTVPADFQAELDALSPRILYCAEMGWKQSISDGTAGIADEAAFKAKILKKADAVIAGTVRVAGSGDRAPTKTPVEREIWRLATAEMAEVFAKNAKAGNPVPKERQARYIGLFIDRERERLTDLAMAAVPIAAAAEDDLDALFAVMEDEEESDEEESDEEAEAAE
jgi:hypothetical protein